VVRWKEGDYAPWMHVSEFHDDRFNEMVLLDNNWYALKDWFFDNSQWLIDHEVVVVVEQGMDIRFINEEIAEQLFKIKWKKGIKFAWDNIRDEKAVLRGIEILENAGFNLRADVSFYVLTDFDTTPEQDIYRCQKLKELGTNAFVMAYQKPSPKHPEPLRQPHIRHLQRWADVNGGSILGMRFSRLRRQATPKGARQDHKLNRRRPEHRPERQIRELRERDSITDFPGRALGFMALSVAGCAFVAMLPLPALIRGIFVVLAAFQALIIGLAFHFHIVENPKRRRR